MQWYNGVESNAQRYSKARKIPQKGFSLFFHILFSHFNKVLLANAVFLLFCLPVVTIPAALTALSRVYIVLLNDGYVQVFRDFYKEFKESFVNSLLLGLLYAAATALLFIAARFYPSMAKDETVAMLIFCAATAAAIIVNVIFSYAFPMNAQFKLKARHIVKNSALMTILCLKTSLVLALLSVLCNAVAVYLFPQSLPVMLTVFMAIYQLAVYVAVREPFKKHLMPKEIKED